MKKLLIAALAAIALASCRKAELPGPGADGEYVDVTCGITTDEVSGRAFFDNDSRPEVWETELKTVTIFGLTPSGTQLLRYEMTPAEITSGRAKLRLIKKVYDFYVVANFTVPESSRGYQKIASTYEAQFTAYNGTAAGVMAACKRPEGFVMTGRYLNVDPTQVTGFTCGLKRSVAKIALRVKAAPTLSAAYPGGRLRIDNTRFTGMSMNTTLFTEFVEVRGPTYYTQQAPVNPSANVWDALFYCYWNPAQTADKYPKITITGVFDRDGDFSTTGDRQTVTRTLLVNPHGDGSIRANGYYRIEANIRQLP